MQTELLSCFPRPPRPYQFDLIRDVIGTLKDFNAVTAGAATGAGKSDCYTALATYGVLSGKKVMIYTNRRLLATQTIDNLALHGIACGVRAATLSDKLDPDASIQVSSMQTEIARTLKTNRWDPFPADYVIVDEAHLMCQGRSLEILRRHVHSGAKLIGFTATPVCMSHLYPVLVYRGKPSECLKYGAHVRAMIRAPFEFDLGKVKKVKINNYDINSFKQEIWSQQVVGKIVESWQELNPQARLTLVFAPDIECSIGLCDRFRSIGVSACHIDGKQIYVDGEFYRDHDGSIRKRTLERARSGDIKVICNRFCLREGVDLPEIFHLILAAPIQNLKTYIQTIGRVVRYSPSTPDQVLITDHCGNYYRFMCGPNTDLDWETLYCEEDEQVHEKKIVKRHREDPSLDPIVCPFCHTVRRFDMPRCPPAPFGCGKDSGRTGKMIIDKKGELTLIDQPNFRSKVEPKESEDQRRWDQVYYSCRRNSSNRGKSFLQALVVFKRKFGYTPPRNLDRMPVSSDEAEWKRKIHAVDKAFLRGGEFCEQE